ncbi:hypothetical protein IMG5_153320 [Ichthyophthirius multifiliis]|uniref:WD repeat protein n=1 Tax=Ichthyophthirius multifiliis TaxID=5932 RepID=G0QYY9_ICHMU|nr:hypothetical protein IMG5_153320 [Ichthyophthirius multifiliis]EGR29560.1 hypothetical protein IMG5_153320 [Ichthyophthirius multifiliis]|eukprot:XP_004030796.1 hypothetical protein IMG5_153320 [Ichthyophthirius multifiliis]
MSQYCECKQPTELIKPHACEIVKKKQEISQQRINEKVNMSIEAVTRTETFVEGKGIIQSTGIQNLPILNQQFLFQNLNQMKLDQTNQEICKKINSFYNKSLLLKNQTQFLYLIIVYEDGFFQVLDKSLNQLSICKIEGIENLKDVKWNPDYYNILALEFSNSFEIIDITTTETVKFCDFAIIQFQWKYFVQYLYLDTNYTIYLCSMTENQPIHIIQADVQQKQYIYYYFQKKVGTVDMTLNYNSSLLATFSSQENTVKIWTFSEQSYVLEFVDEEQIQYYSWGKTTSGNIIITMTEKIIKIWDVEFGELKWNLDLQERIIDFCIMESIKKLDRLVVFTENQGVYKIGKHINFKTKILIQKHNFVDVITIYLKNNISYDS